MMDSVNLIGRLARDPEVRYTQGAEPMATARFTLAVDRGYGDNKKTEWIPVVAFRKTAEFCEKYLNKGRLVSVSGYLHSGSYTNKNGDTVYTLDVVAEHVNALDRGNTQGQEQTQGQPQQGYSQQQAAPAQNPAPAPATAPVPAPAPAADDGFMNIPDGIEEELPFN